MLYDICVCICKIFLSANYRCTYLLKLQSSPASRECWTFIKIVRLKVDTIDVTICVCMFVKMSIGMSVWWSVSLSVILCEGVRHLLLSGGTSLIQNSPISRHEIDIHVFNVNTYRVGHKIWHSLWSFNMVILFIIKFFKIIYLLSIYKDCFFDVFHVILKNSCQT